MHLVEQLVFEKERENLGVVIKKNRPVVSSRDVARVFEKDHNKVLRDIRELACSSTFRLSNFGQSSYINEQSREMPEYLMTRDGFTLLAMGYTGEKAMRFKEAYIFEFSRMEESLRTGQFDRRDARALIENLDVSTMCHFYLDLDQKHKQLQAHVEEIEPKAEVFDLFISGENAQPMEHVAKALGTGRNRLFRFLREKRVLLPNGLPYQRYLDRGYFRVVETPYMRGDVPANRPKTLVTAKGFDYLQSLMRVSSSLPARAQSF